MANTEPPQFVELSSQVQDTVLVFDIHFSSAIAGTGHLWAWCRPNIDGVGFATVAFTTPFGRDKIQVEAVDANGRPWLDVPGWWDQCRPTLLFSFLALAIEDV